MAINELHSRLEYLVSYSSQLIFISCESLSQQQTSLQQFIAKQHENTEVAFINGESKLRDSDYRNEIYRQLVSHPLSPTIPLDQQLIQQIPKETGPILLCICAAQHISTKLLNELWSLVLKNKDLNKGHHLNVLLFGSPEWTESAKTDLAKDNQHLPILLSSEIVSANPFTESYSQSINQKRAQINQQMNGQVDSDSGSIIRKPLFKIVAGLVFIGVFLMLIFWQYPEEIKQFLDPHYPHVDTPLDDLAESQLNSAYSEEILDTQVEEQQPDDPILQPEDDLSDQASAISPENSIQDSQELVTSWQQEVQKQQDRTQQATQKIEPQLEKQQTPPQTKEIDPLVTHQVVHPILELNDNLFVLQLASMRDPAVATQYIEQHNLADSHWLYTTQRFGGDWHVIIFQKTFINAQQARQYANSLPDSIDKSVPFAKSVKQIKLELAVSKQ